MRQEGIMYDSDLSMSGETLTEITAFAAISRQAFDQVRISEDENDNIEVVLTSQMLDHGDFIEVWERLNDVKEEFDTEFTMRCESHAVMN